MIFHFYLQKKTILFNLPYLQLSKSALMQAMGLMLPRCPDNTSQAKSSLEGKLDCMSLNGYSYTARENVDLNRYHAASALWACWSRHCTACHQYIGSLEQKDSLEGCSQLQADNPAVLVCTSP